MIFKDTPFKYHMPTKIIFKKQALLEINQYINSRKTVLITSKGFVSMGVVDKIQALCGKDIVGIFSNIKSHPEFVDLERIYNEIHKIDFELILAVGGGSVLDAAKFFSIYNHEKKAAFVSGIIKKQIEKKDYMHIPIISIPTTAGTGSEITPWATIWDMQSKKKYSLHLPELFSEIAVYDPSLTLTAPKDITIQTGLDALSHSLESIWNKNANELTINYAVKASRIILKYLPLLVQEPTNISHRTKMLKACMYSALAFSNTQTAMAHAMSYYITAHKGISHGIACSFTLPMLLDNIIGKYDFIDRALQEIFGTLSSAPLREMFEAIGISTNFSDYGISEQEWESIKVSILNNERATNSLVSIN
ncbi:MAG: phosphonoacetaldehyde reductase [Helicobacteraceae bacterium]